MRKGKGKGKQERRDLDMEGERKKDGLDEDAQRAFVHCGVPQPLVAILTKLRRSRKRKTKAVIILSVRRERGADEYLLMMLLIWV